MKPLDILDALSDLPEDYAGIATRQTESQNAVPQNAQSAQGGIVMKTQGTAKKNQPMHIGKAGIAAAVAVCIGLNAALIYGITKMKSADNPIPFAEISADTGVSEQETGLLHMELLLAMPTSIVFQVRNETGEDEVPFNPQFIVAQNGEKVADASFSPRYTVPPTSIPAGMSEYEIVYEQLPAGSYTLVNLAEDGTSEGTLGHLDFEISAEYDSMIRIPDVRSMKYEEAKALLEEAGVSVSRVNVVRNENPPVEIGSVAKMNVPLVSTEERADGLRYEYHHDGTGCWVRPGETIELLVYIGTGTDGEKIEVPDVTGMDAEEAITLLINSGFFVEKRSIYDEKVPEGKVVSQEPEPGTEASGGTDVRVSVSLGNSRKMVTVPDFNSMQWEDARDTAKELGLLPGKIYLDSQGEPAGTVMFQSFLPGDEVGEGTVFMMNVAKDPEAQPPYMTFSVPEGLHGLYYIYVRDAAGEMIGVGYPFKPNGYAPNETVYPDCTADNTAVEAVLVNYETNQEAVIGSYVLHPDTSRYDTVSEDIAAAFRQVNE